MRDGSRPKSRIASRDRPAARVDALEELVVDGADQRAAADERHAEAHAFFLGEPDDLDRERQRPALKQIDERDGQHDAEHAVERAGVAARCRDASR